MRSVLVVLTAPVPGREDEYHEWYDRVHLADVLDVPGVVSAARFAPAAGSDEPRFLALYEVEGDPTLVVSELQRRWGTPAMGMSGALDMGSVSMTAWVERPAG